MKPFTEMCFYHLKQELCVVLQFGHVYCQMI